MEQPAGRCSRIWSIWSGRGEHGQRGSNGRSHDAAEPDLNHCLGQVIDLKTSFAELVEPFGKVYAIC
jgi:hypothetical protein